LTLSAADWAAIVGYLLITLFSGFISVADREKHGRLFRVGPQRFVVAGGNVDGGDDFCCGHAACGDRIGLHAGVAGNWLWWSFFLRE